MSVKKGDWVELYSLIDEKYGAGLSASNRKMLRVTLHAAEERILKYKAGRTNASKPDSKK